MQETTTHQFDLKVKVGEGEAKEIVLSWEDKGYSKEVRKGLRPTEKEKEEKEKKKAGSKSLVWNALLNPKNTDERNFSLISYTPAVLVPGWYRLLRLSLSHLEARWSFLLQWLVCEARAQMLFAL